MIRILPIVVFLKFAALLLSGAYKKFWRYTDTHEIIKLAQVLLVPSLVMLVPRLFGLFPKGQDLFALSYGVLVIDFLLALSLLGAIRLLRAYLVEQRNIKNRLLKIGSEQKNTLVLGAGEAGLQVLRTVEMHPELGLKVIAVLDDDEKKHGMEVVPGALVRGPVDELSYWVDELSIEQIIIAMPSIDRQRAREINTLAAETGVDIRTIPGVDQLAGGQVTVEQIRKLSMEDLLGRDEVDLNLPEVNAYLKGKKVLVTGAGGSIGSEISRQLVKNCQIESLCILGKGENSIFNTLVDLNNIQDDLEERASESQLGGKVELVAKIADIRNGNRIRSIIEEFKPDVVFHAAAHKHVHLMELNICEAFDNNVLGTQNLAKLSGEAGVGTFVLVSTDKAVNPTSIMGTTKSLAEKVVLRVSDDFPQTKFTAVRFGNVLGSRGSVIQVWERQLRDSRPITVTHKEAIRYFMTIPEAAQLVIKSGAVANNAEIMVLDMGTPVNIYELAKQFIQLSGFDLDDVSIEIIGLKEGEKLYEELLTDAEFVESKLTEKIYKAKIGFDLEAREFDAELLTLEDCSSQNNGKELRSMLQKLVSQASLV